MSQPINHPNLKRRRVIQGVVISTAALAAPGLVSAASSTGTSRRAQANLSLPENRLKPISEDIAMELVETEQSLSTGNLARISITNNSNRPIKLSHLSPGAISTQKGVYQINATLRNNPLTIQSGGVYQLWLRPDDGTQALLSNKPKPVPGESIVSTTLEVSVLTNVESGSWTGIQRLQALIS